MSTSFDEPSIVTEAEERPESIQIEVSNEMREGIRWASQDGESQPDEETDSSPPEAEDDTRYANLLNRARQLRKDNVDLRRRLEGWQEDKKELGETVNRQSHELLAQCAELKKQDEQLRHANIEIAKRDTQLNVLLESAAKADSFRRQSEVAHRLNKAINEWGNEAVMITSHNGLKYFTRYFFVNETDGGHHLSFLEYGKPYYCELNVDHYKATFHIVTLGSEIEIPDAPNTKEGHGESGEEQP